MSQGRTIPLVEQSAKSGPPPDSTRADRWCTLNEGVVQTLMISLAMIVRDELRHRAAEVPPDRK
jgi:hypothetical protein